MKQLLFISLLSFLLTGCSSDPLNQKYAEADGIKPLLSAKPPIDPTVLSWILDAAKTNDSLGISNDEKTFKELSDQGGKLSSERKAAAYIDNMKRKIEAEQQAKTAP